MDGSCSSRPGFPSAVHAHLPLTLPAGGQAAPVARATGRRDADDARRGGGPQDQALYSCVCGYAFKATVTTSVGCPHCGTEQAW